MTEISQLDINSPGMPSRGNADQETTNRGRDWLLRLLVAGVLLALVAAFSVGLLLLWGYVVPGFNLQLVKVSALPTSLPIPAIIGDNLNLQQVGFALLAGLFCLALILYLLARWRFLRKRFLWPAAGCPTCEHQTLVRVHRRRKDRLFAWIGIPVGRYHCRECRWQGLRIQRGMQVAVKSDEWTEALDAALNNSSTARGAGLRGRIDLGKLVATAAYGASNVQRTAKSSDPAGFTAAAIGEAAPAVQESGTTAEQATTGGEEPTVDVAATMLAEGHAVPDAAESQSAEQGGAPAYAPHGDSQPGDEPAENSELTQERMTGKAAARGEITAPFGLNLRADPQPDGALLGLLEPGTSVILLDKVAPPGSTGWQHVQFNDQQGWVLSAFIKDCK